MSRLPIPKQDKNTWGEILLDFLHQAHLSNGHEKFPIWENSSQRPTQPFTGMIGANKELGGLELFNGSLWIFISKKELESGGGRLFSERLDETVSVKDFGAKGDGHSDDSQAFQLALSVSKSVFVPQSHKPYRISRLKIPGHSCLFGEGKNSGATLEGLSSTDPMLEMVLGMGESTAQLRKTSLKGLTLKSYNQPAISIREFHNFELIDCHIVLENNLSPPRDKNAVHCLGSYRALVENCHIEILGGGAGFCFYGMDNVNGNLLVGNEMSGGVAGGAISCGQNQVTEILDNKISHSRHGIWIGSSEDVVNNGSSYSLVIKNNIIEDCFTPIKMGTYRVVTGAFIQGNHIKNRELLSIRDREVCFSFFRMRNSYIGENIFELHPSEVLYGMEMPSSLSGYNPIYMKGNQFAQNVVIGGDSEKKFKVIGSPNQSVLSDFGGSNQMGKMKVLTYLSPPISTHLGVGVQIFAPTEGLTLGGKVLKVELVNVRGSLAGATLRVGTSFHINAFSLNLSTLTLDRGYANLGYEGRIIYPEKSGIRSVYRVDAGSGSGSFQVRITYRAS